MGSTIGRARPAERAARDVRAFELAVKGKSTRQISEIMRTEGYRNVSHVTVSKLIRQHAAEVVLPLAQEHVAREFERLMEQRQRLDAMRERAQLVLDRFHVTVSHGSVIYLYDDDETPEEAKERKQRGERRAGGTPLRDDGPELQAITVMLGIEDRVLKNAEAMARLFGYNAAAEVNVTMTTETDTAIRALTEAMTANEDTSPVDVRG